MLELVDIHTYYGDSYVLQGVSMKVEKGSVVALLGRNGMGKTTTIHSIMGFTPPRRGKILFHDHDLAHRSPKGLLVSVSASFLREDGSFLPSACRRT